MTGTERTRGRAAPSSFVRCSFAGRGPRELAGAVLVALAMMGGGSRARAFDGPMCAPGESSEPHATASMTPTWLAGEAGPRPTAPLLACLGPPAYTGAATPSAPSMPATSQTARRAYEALLAHMEAGRSSDALVSLASLRELVPELSDRWDLFEGELRSADRRGCDAFERAVESPHSAIAARARVGQARCLLEVGDRRAESTLRALLARYPELPEALDLRALEAGAREARGDVRGAIAIYREIDLQRPDTPPAVRARAALERLAAAGHRVPAYTPTELVARLDVIVRRGAPDFARAELERLQAMALPRAQQAEVTLLSARVARVEGRFEEAAALEQRARGGAPASAEPAPEAAEPSAAQEEARAELARLAGRARTLRRVPTTRLFGYLRTAARAGLRAEVDAALDEIASRSLPCGLRLDAGVLASGAGDDARVASVLEGCVSAPGSIGIAARYHRARALERLGRADEARAELEAVLTQDRAGTQWYALWARQRLSALGEAAAGAGAPVAAAGEGKGGEVRVPLDPTRAAQPPIVLLSSSERATTTARGDGAPNVEPADADDEDSELAAEPTAGPRWTPMPRDEIERRLAEIAAAHGEAYPWLGRALAMLRLGDTHAATDELHEAFLAWHQARGRGTLRAGVEAVYRGATPPRMRTESSQIWRARRALGGAETSALGDIAASLGDHGLGIRFGGRQRVQMLPRAYESIVNEVARERGLDPNLLLAVMRVESVYNPRIVSYAGAVGLLQIMPRTGRLIARAMGREAEFGVDDLLDPRTNIEFAAWYLSSLIRRFEGRVPLAVAAYNGGPHNVRRWLSEHSDQMPIDAFCERIPFTQTHRYVRRVLSHWQAYRAQQGLPMAALDPTIPDLDPDHVAF